MSHTVAEKFTDYCCASTKYIKYFYYGYLQFLDNVIINKTNVFLPQTCVTIADFAITFRPFGFITPKTLNYLAFQSFYFECTR